LGFPPDFPAGSRHPAGTAGLQGRRRPGLSGGLQPVRGAGQAAVADQLDQHGGGGPAAVAEHSAPTDQFPGRIGAEHQHTDHLGGAAGNPLGR